MAISPGDMGSGSGLGTAGSVCTISPQDTERIFNNLISRIEKLEFNLTQILGANLHANTLSDISSQVGWVYNVEYMGEPGWIRTEAGTLIPPPGFTLLGSGIKLSDGNTYNAVVMDSDGVLQFGFDTEGGVSGSAVAPVAYAIWSGGTGSGGIFANPEQEYTKNITEVSNTFDTAQLNTPFTSQTATYRVSAAGLYIISVSAIQMIFNTTGSVGASFSIAVTATNNSSDQIDWSSVYTYDPDITTTIRAYGSTVIPWRANSNDSVTITISPGYAGTGTVGQYSLHNIHLSLFCVGPLT